MNHKLPMLCGKCKNEWHEYFELPMNVKSFVARGKGTLCPKCASKKVYIKTNKANPAGEA